MKRMRKALCLFLSLLLCLSSFPVSVLAADGEESAEELVAESPEIEEAPVEEAPPEETPIEETPVEEAPVEEAPTEEAPVEELAEEVETVEVTFVCPEADLALLAVFAAGDREHPVEAKEPGVYELLPGEYVYTYPGVDETAFTVGAEALTVSFALSAVVEETPAEEPAEPEEAPVEEAPIEEAPVEEEPVEEEPVEETPAEEESVEAEEAPTEEPLPAMVSLASPGVSAIDSGSCGEGVFWSLSTNGVLTISGSGFMDDYSDSGNSSPWAEYADQISSLVVSEGVTRIGNYAFCKLSNLASVSLPESVTSIGSYAFYDCSALTSIGVPDGVLSLSPFTFGMCTSLQSVTLPSTMNTIGEGAFLRCEALTDITLPRDLNVICDKAFFNCYGMTGTFTIPVSVYEIGSQVFGGTPLTDFAVESGNFYFSTDEYGFLFNYSKSELIKAPEGSTISVTYAVPDTVSSIRPYALSYLKDMRGVVLPWGLTAIPEGMLFNTYHISWLDIPNGVTSIGANAFASLNYLEGVTIPGSVEQIDSTAFSGDENLKSVTVDESNSWFCNDGYGAVLNAAQTGLVFFPRTYTGVYVIPRSVHFIADCAFEDCRLCQVDIPAAVDLGEWAFLHCSNLHFVKLPEIGYVSRGAFSGCYALEAVFIPRSVTLIDTYAFEYCTSLKRLYYAGSDEQFNQIVVNGGNDPLNDVSRRMNVLDAGYCGAALDWMLTADGGLNIYGHGGMFNYASNVYTPWADYLEPQMTCNFPGITFVEIASGVTTVGDYAFCGCSALEQLVLADTVTDVGAHAFGSCTILSDITWSAGLKTIGDYAFGGIAQSYIFLPDGVETLGEGAFDCCLAETIIIPDSVTAIGDSSFWGCKNLSYIRLSENVKVLGGTMFSYDTALESIHIPASVEYLYERAFLGCENLMEILVDEDSQTYKTINGCVYTRDGKKLVTVPEGITGAFVIPDGVTEIGDYACESCKNISYVKLPDSLAKIGYYAFGGCSSLYSIDIPGSVTTIALDAFPTRSYGGTLRDIWFYGTEAMWNQIEPDPNGFQYAYYTREEMMEELVGIATLHFVPTLDKPVLTLQNTASGVKCSWNTVENAEDYLVYRDGGDGNGYVTAGNAKRTEFTDAGAENGRSYDYIVRAFASGFRSKDSDPVSITCVKTLAAPSFTVTNTASGVKLTWNAVANAEGYRISRKGPGESEFTILDTVTGGSYTDKTAVEGSIYYYRVRAVNGSVLSGYTTQKMICVRKFAKIDFTMTNTSSGVKLAWTAVANAAGYRISRKGPGESSFKVLDTVTGKSYTDKTAENGKAYSYRVRVVNGSVISNYTTKTITCVTALEQPVPNAPSNTSSGVKLSWSTVANAEGYRITRKGPGETSYSVLDIVTGKTYTDKTAEDGFTYSYIVRAVNGSVLSSYTAKSILCVKTLSKPAPTLTNTANGVKLTWSAVANAKTYRISRKAPDESGYTVINTVTGRSYTDKTAEDGVTYSYRVRAMNGSVISGYSTKTITCVKTLAKPTATLTNVTAGVKLSWGAVANAEGYRITRKGPGESSYTLLDTVTGRTFTDKTAEKGKTYSYIVRAVNGSVLSGYTAKSITVK